MVGGLGPGGRRGPDRWLLVAVGAVLAIVVFDGGAIAANAVLSTAYSPQRAVSDYFAAQGRSDVSAMMANATFLKGSDPVFFGSSAIGAMMEVPQNSDVHNVHIVSSQSVDPATEIVSVAMIWAAHHRRQAYTVRRDSSRVHDLIYHSWRIVIPFVSIQLVLPNQAGPMAVDNMNTATPDPSTIQVVQGFHNVTMNGNFLYDATTRLVDGVDDAGVLGLPFAVGAAAHRLAAKAVAVAFVSCDASKYDGCLNHTYSARPGYQYTWSDLPGYGRVVGSTYRLTLAADPTAYMNLAVMTAAGIVDAFGGCAITMTVDGSRIFNFNGGWSATLTWDNGAFVASVSYDCFAASASSGVTT